MDDPNSLLPANAMKSALGSHPPWAALAMASATPARSCRDSPAQAQFPRPDLPQMLEEAAQKIPRIGLDLFRRRIS